MPELMKQNVDVEEEWTALKSIEISDKGTNRNDIEAAKKKLNDAIKSGSLKDQEWEEAVNNKDEAFIQKYISSNLSIDRIDLLKYLASANDRKSSEMIIGLLTKEENKLPNRPALGMVKSNYYGELDDSYKIYDKSVKDYNVVCRSILDIAITSKNQYLAQRVISKPKQALSIQDLGDWCRVVEKEYDHSSVYEAFKVSLDNSDCNAIKVSYQEAVRSGSFR